MKYLRRGSGYYIDVGAADLVANGQVPVKHGQVIELTETGVKLDSGEELPADLVVYATGYGSMNGLAADIVGQEIADAVGKVWGLGSDTTKDPGPWEGEQRNMWKPTQQEGAVVPRRQPAPVPLLLALPRAAAQGPGRGHPDPGVRAAGGAPHVVTRRLPRAVREPQGCGSRTAGGDHGQLPTQHDVDPHLHDCVPGISARPCRDAPGGPASRRNRLPRRRRTGRRRRRPESPPFAAWSAT